MRVTVVLDSTNQIPNMGSVINSTMSNEGWFVLPTFPYAFENEIDSNIEATITKDVTSACATAGWGNVKYLYVIDTHLPQFGVANGL